MKQQIILWISSFVIAFLTGYASKISSSEYPVTGSFGIEMKRVSFKLNKVYRGNDAYKIIIATELDSLNGLILWRQKGLEKGWENSPMYFSKGILSGEIPHHPPPSTLEYRVKIWKNDSIYFLPQPGSLTLTYLGKVPSTITGFYYFTLYLALIFSIRTGLDYFNENQKIKKLTIFTVLLWISNVMIFNPVKNTYELSSRVGMEILPIEDLFDIQHLSLLFLWIIALIMIFNLKHYRSYAIISAALTVVLFFLLKL